MSKIRKIIWREWTERVRKKSFIVTTIVMPVLGFGIILVAVLFMALTPESQIFIRVVDRAGFVTSELELAFPDTLSDGNRQFVFETYSGPGREIEAIKKELNQGIEQEEFGAYLIVPEDVLDSGEVQLYGRKVSNIDLIQRLEGGLTSIMAAKRLEGSGMNYEEVKRLTARVDIRTRKIEAGEEKAGGFASEYFTSFAMVAFIFMSILLWGQVLVRGVIEEKTSRVMEVLISSVTPYELMTGKILGISLVAITQYAIWVIVFLIGLMYALSSGVPVQQFVDVSFSTALYFAVFFTFGLLMYGSLFAAVGSVCNSEQDAQNLQQPITWSLLIPYMMPFFVIQNPDSTIAVVLSLIPIFSPMLMFMRINVLMPPTWQVVLSLVLMSLTLYLLWRGTARIFRIGVLMYGKKPGIREILRWARA